jgi:hypothetical protein
MLKIIFLCRRRPDITREQYAAFVLEGHAPLALKHHPTLLRYVINIAEGTPPGGPEIDSLPALYFASLEYFRERLYDSPEGQEIIRRDVVMDVDLAAHGAPLVLAGPFYRRMAKSPPARERT